MSARRRRRPRLPPGSGLSIRKREASVKMTLNRYHPCPRCNALRVRRVSAGIWRCRKCGFTFVGGAYRPSTELGKMAERVISRVRG